MLDDKATKDKEAWKIKIISAFIGIVVGSLVLWFISGINHRQQNKIAVISTKEAALEKTDKSGGIQGSLYSKVGVFEPDSFNADLLQGDEYLRPFMGYNDIGDTVVYGAGIESLPVNHGYFFGIILRYLDGAVKEDVL